MSGVNLIGWAAGVFGILVIIAGALGTLAVFRVSRNGAILAQYKEAADASQSVAAALRTEVDQLRTQLSGRDAIVAALSAKVTVLSDLVTGHSAIEQLTAAVTLLTTVKEDTRREMGQMHAEITEVLKQVTAHETRTR